MRILVTGSRYWEDQATIYRALCQASMRVPDSEIILVHGGARGADRIAASFADAMGWRVQVHPALWDIWGKRAGIMRNIQMVDSGADICLAFIKDSSPGATHCANYAESKGIPVRRFVA